MRIIEVIPLQRSDFEALIQCEHCQNIDYLKGGYNDTNYHKHVLPTKIFCTVCFKNTVGDVNPQIGNFLKEEFTITGEELVAIMSVKTRTESLSRLRSKFTPMLSEPTVKALAEYRFGGVVPSFLSRAMRLVRDTEFCIRNKCDLPGIGGGAEDSAHSDLEKRSSLVPVDPDSNDELPIVIHATGSEKNNVQ